MSALESSAAQISFGHHIWGPRGRGGIGARRRRVVTDLKSGAEWTASSLSALAAAPGVHEHIMEILERVGSPEDYR